VCFDPYLRQRNCRKEENDSRDMHTCLTTPTFLQEGLHSNFGLLVFRGVASFIAIDEQLHKIEAATFAIILCCSTFLFLRLFLPHIIL